MLIADEQGVEYSTRGPKVSVNFRAVNNARVCLNTLNCPAEVNEMSESFRNSVSHTVTESQCLAAGERHVLHFNK